MRMTDQEYYHRKAEQATKERDELREQVARLEEDNVRLSELVEARIIYVPDDDKARGELFRLRAALEKYGRHEEECPIERDTRIGVIDSRSRCICGLVEALKGAGEGGRG